MIAIQRPPLTNQENVEQIELTVEIFHALTEAPTLLHQTACKFPVVPLASECVHSPVIRYLVSVEGSVRLSAVRWTVGGALEESLKRRVRQDGVFWLLPDTLCKLHDSISQLAGSSKKLSLRLLA